MELNGPITSGSHESKYSYGEVKGALEGSYLDSKDLRIDANNFSEKGEEDVNDHAFEVKV